MNMRSILLKTVSLLVCIAVLTTVFVPLMLSASNIKYLAKKIGNV